ncbi:MAG: hypothetical protein ACHRXM_05500 [Isosphaerales bacterium]
MSKFCWIDLDEAAVRLSSTPESVKSLIDEGVLSARTFDGSELVVRSDEVANLAEMFSFNKPVLRGPHVPKGRASGRRSGGAVGGRQ